MKKKRLGAAALLLTSCLFTGCVFPAENYEFVMHEGIAPPEGGWTVQSLAEVSYVQDVKLSYPLTLNTFGEKYTYEKIYEPEYYKENRFTTLKRFNDDVGTVILAEPDPKAISADTEITYMGLWDNMPDFCINGITAGSSYDDVVAAFGEPDYEYQNDNTPGGNRYVQYDNTENGEGILLIKLTANSVCMVTLNFSEDVSWHIGQQGE